MKSDKKWMIYGANGYTGRIVVDEAIKKNLKPILAGRSASIKALAEEKGLEYEIFDLSSIENIALKLSNISVLANCAGPFSETANLMIPACIKSNTHYIDITGEISVYDYAHSKHNEAVSSNIVLCPGVGSDVIPTDCLAAYLKDILSHLPSEEITIKLKTSISAALFFPEKQEKSENLTMLLMPIRLND